MKRHLCCGNGWGKGGAGGRRLNLPPRKEGETVETKVPSGPIKLKIPASRPPRTSKLDLSKLPRSSGLWTPSRATAIALLSNNRPRVAIDQVF